MSSLLYHEIDLIANRQRNGMGLVGVPLTREHYMQFAYDILAAQDARVVLLQKQLTAAHCALTAVGEFAGRLSESSEPFRLEAGEDLENLLTRHGVHQ